MDWTTTMRDIKRDLKDLRPTITETHKAFGDLARAATKPGALETKHKELIAVGIAISERCAECIGFHVQSAILAGATREEISETVGMAIYMGGGPALMYGAKALAAYDHFTAPKEG